MIDPPPFEATLQTWKDFLKELQTAIKDDPKRDSNDPFAMMYRSEIQRAKRIIKEKEAEAAAR